MSIEAVNDFFYSLFSAFDFLGLQVIYPFINKIMSYPVTYYALFFMLVPPAIVFVILWLQDFVSDGAEPYPIGRFNSLPVDSHGIFARGKRQCYDSAKYYRGLKEANEYFEKNPQMRYVKIGRNTFYNQSNFKHSYRPVKFKPPLPTDKDAPPPKREPNYDYLDVEPD